MTDPVVLATEEQIVAGLTDDRLVPPPGPAGTGSTLALRAAMARFSGPADHGPRRAAVDAVLRSLDPAAAARVAGADAAERLVAFAPQTVEVITAIARPAAVAAIAHFLGVEVDDTPQVIRDVDAIAAVIGRGTAPNAEADGAADRLLARFGAHPDGAVAVVSVLYQSMDATASLVATRLVTGTVERAVVPIARTVRTALHPLELGGVRVAAGATVHVELGAAGMWFGAGPHACPGRELAEATAAAIVAAISAARFTVSLAGVVLDAGGRPTAVPITPPGSWRDASPGSSALAP